MNIDRRRFLQAMSVACQELMHDYARFADNPAKLNWFLPALAAR